MLSCEGVGKTIEKAIEDALLILKAPREDVDIKILEEGGLFKKAKVLVSISEEYKSKYENKNKKIEEEDLTLDVKSIFENITEPEVKENIIEETENVEIKDEQTEPSQNHDECQEIEENEQPNIVNFEKEQIDDIKCVEFLKGLCEKLNINSSIQCYKYGEKVLVDLVGENSSDLIGYRGDCLNAVQYLLNIYEQRSGEENKVVLNIENYREKRETTLINLANRMARKVAKTKHQVKLEPMTPNERRIIHTALQNDAYVTTFSKGTEPNRYLIIAPKH